LIVGLTFGTTLLWCAAAAYSTYVSYRELNEAFDIALKEAGWRLLPLAAGYAQRRGEADIQALHRLDQGPDEYLSYLVRDAGGRVVFQAHDASSLPYEPTLAPGFKTIGQYRLYTGTDPATGYTITIAETIHGRIEAATGTILAVLWPLAALIPLNALVIWMIVRQAMRPVLRLSNDIAARGSQNLAALDTLDQPFELRPIADAVARLLERLKAALDAERAFAANCAHELRTPLAGALAQTQRLIAELTDGKDRRRARDVEATLKRVSGLTEKVLQLSRADAGVGARDRDVDLVPVLDLLVDDCDKHVLEHGRIHYEKPDSSFSLVRRVDVDAFAIVVRNLIDNALKHGVDGAAVEVIAASDGTIRIINECPTVSPEVLADLKRRFVRGETRHAGSGLGLAIAETIMARTGGKLDLLSPPPGRASGFEARLSLPPAAHTGDSERNPNSSVKSV
jgi:two-component system OmpR family sensor kinase